MRHVLINSYTDNFLLFLLIFFIFKGANVCLGSTQVVSVSIRNLLAVIANQGNQS